MSELNLTSPATYLLYCEGSAERVIMEIVLDARMLVFGQDEVIPERMTGRPTIQRGNPNKMASQYLQESYEAPVVILYILDSRKEHLRLPKYAAETPVHYFLTRPEIEILAIIREGMYVDFTNQSGKDAAEYCKTTLGMPKIKQEAFLRDYWNASDLRDAVIEYSKKHKFEKGELSLANLLR